MNHGEVFKSSKLLDDQSSRLDRFERDLHKATPGDPRDTTTPDAMRKTMRKILLGSALAPASRDRITRGLVDNKAGNKSYAPGYRPAGGRRQDRWLRAWHQLRHRRSVAARADACAGTSYLPQTSADLAVRDRAIAEVGRLVVGLVGWLGCGLGWLELFVVPETLWPVDRVQAVPAPTMGQLHTRRCFCTAIIN